MFIQMPSENSNHYGRLYHFVTIHNGVTQIRSFPAAVSDGTTASRIIRNLSDYINDLQGQQSSDAKDFCRQLAQEAGKMRP